MFITFLIEKFPHLRFAYSTDKEMIEHFLSGEVTIPFTDILKYVEEWESLKPKLPSQYQVGDRVKFCCMPDDHKIETFPSIPAEILAVHFYENKVKYDLDLLFVENQRSRIYNVDSVLVLPTDIPDSK